MIPYFFLVGAIIIVMRLPSRTGMFSARPNSSSSTAKRRSCFSPWSLNMIERPRKKIVALTLVFFNYHF